MQPNVVKAFCQRLGRAGFTDVMIFDCCNGSYILSCCDRDGKIIRGTLTEVQMRNRSFCVWFIN